MNINWDNVIFFLPSGICFLGLIRSCTYICFRRFAGKKVGHPFIVHSSYREGDKGTHGKGLAVDGHFVGVPLIDQYLAAERACCSAVSRFVPALEQSGDPFRHVRRVTKEKGGSRWGRNAAGVYVALDAKFLIECF